jgi:hypothetical protein
MLYSVYHHTRLDLSLAISSFHHINSDWGIEKKQDA